MTTAYRLLVVSLLSTMLSLLVSCGDEPSGDTVCVGLNDSTGETCNND
jgi:hypothetical protein